MVKKFLLGHEKNALRDSAVWNMISSMEYALQSAVLLVVITRKGTIYDAGVFTIAYTLAQMMVTIGYFGARNFQASDSNKKYHFSDYFSMRVCTTALMFAVTMAYACFQKFDRTKYIITFVLCIYRMLESIEDVFHGELQRELRLDIATRIVSIRIFVCSAAFVVSYYISANLFLACIVLTVLAFMITVSLNLLVIPDFTNIKVLIKKDQISTLLIACFPVCIGEFSYSYLVNLPKYAIDRNYPEEIQTVFCILFMPIFAINLMSSFVFKPSIAKMGIYWNEGNKHDFFRLIKKQIVFIILITGIVVLGGRLVGLQLLSIVYNIDLMPYLFLFLMYLLFGGIAAMVVFLVAVLTIIRHQKIILIAYIIMTLVCTFLSDFAVIQNALWGAGILYGIGMTGVLTIMFIGIICLLITNKKPVNGQ